MKIDNLKEKVMGCIIGGAVGDALGAPFEGLWSDSIPEKSILLSAYSEFEGYPLGQYTDDTQLTLATIESIIESGFINPANIAKTIFSLFKNQAVIGPGGACRGAASEYFKYRDWRKCGAGEGSAGNGTAMRTAALGLCFLKDSTNLPSIISDVSRITHSDPRSIAGGIVIAKAAQLLATDSNIEAIDFCQSLASTIESIHQSFAQLIRELPKYLHIDRNLALNFIAWAGMRYPEFEKPIITPFIIPTVLASLWSVIKYPNCWSDAVSEAIGLGGDVDTLGAIVGGLMGAKLGINSIPVHLIKPVLNYNYLNNVARLYLIFIEKSLSC
ncbi:MAG: ADP-ribosylglycohydrolase family protein [Acidobacteriota bacterium]